MVGKIQRPFPDSQVANKSLNMSVQKFHTERR